MNYSSTRVVVIYKEVRRPLFYQYGLEEKEIIQKALCIFGLNPCDWEDFEMIIKSLDCKAEDSRYFVMDDILVLRQKDYHAQKADESLEKENSLNGPNNEQTFISTTSNRNNQKTALISKTKKHNS